LGLKRYLSIFYSRRMAVMLLLGFSSGLPLPLTSGTLQAWLTVAGIDLRTIGIFSLVGLPYTVKFLWSPLMDRFRLPWLGRRRGWMVITQFALLIGIGAMGFCSPERAPLAIALLALVVAFISASQDIVVDAYRADVLPEIERGLGAAVFVMGYRIAMIVGGALALVFSDQTGFPATYLLMAVLMTIGVAATILSIEPDGITVPPRSLQEAVWGPLKDFFARRSALLLLVLIVTYKLGDAYAGSMTTPFLIRGVGFTPTDVGTINKGMGLLALILGALFGGTLMMKLGLFRSLLVFGILQMVSNLSFMVLAWAGKSYPIMVFTVAFENLCSGMGTAAFVALLMALCSTSFSATQFALLSSFSALGRVFVSPTSGYLVDAVGWAPFFLVTTFAAIPGLLLLWMLRGTIGALKKGAS
jgi:PAT family beta-lactamase induction signal transducer AmpG